MTDENPRASVSRPAPDVDDTADLPAVPGEGGDPDRTARSLASVFPRRRRRTTEPAGGRHTADRDGAAGASAGGDGWADESDGTGTAEYGDDDEEWDEEPAVPPGKPAGRRRIPRITGALAVAILIGLGFLGGVLVQKNHDEKYTSGSAAGGLPALPQGFNPAALFGGASGGQAPAGSSGAGSTSASPIVIGEVVSVGKTTIVVRNISGKEITVALGSTKTYEKANSEPITSLKAGTNVVVSGRTGADGTATASTITTR